MTGIYGINYSNNYSLTGNYGYGYSTSAVSSAQPEEKGMVAMTIRSSLTADTKRMESRITIRKCLWT